MKKTMLISLMAWSLLEANPTSILEIVVGDSLGGEEFFINDEAKAKNTQKLTQKSIATLGTQANMNPYTIINYMPSVNFTPVDIAGSNEPSFHDPIRIRGKAQSGPGGVFMINSMPLSSNPGGGKQMVDMENISSLELLKGYLPVDKNLGFSSLIGKVDMSVLAPKKKMGAALSQSFGSDDFKRTFIRVDSGKVGDFSVFGSFSYMANEKYKGEGDLRRTNAMLGLSYEPNSSFKADIYAIRNSDKHHNYDSLSYDEAKNLSRYFKKDYKTTKPTTANDVDFYDWNKQDFVTSAVFADILYRPGEDDTITFKPYYKKDKGYVMFSNPNETTPAMSNVINWKMNHDLFGAIASYEHRFSDELKAKIGYSHHEQLPPGPPTNRQAYGVDANGNLSFKKYASLADVDRHTIDTPMVELSGDVSKFSYALGVGYQVFKLSKIDNYDTNTSTSLDYKTAIDSSTFDPFGSVEAKTFRNFLPSAYLAYNVDDESSIYIDYTRTYGFDVNLYPTYTANIANFKAKNIKLQQLWDKLDLELSDNIDMGYKTLLGAITLHPSVFVSFIKNKQANVYDPSLGVNYPANLGDAFGYGAEFLAYGPISDNLEFVAGVSYNRYSFDEDFKINPTTSSDIKGNQMPDAPKVMAKGAITYAIDGFAITPALRYTSSRYGDVENKQKIGSFSVVDLDIAYTKKDILGFSFATFRVSANNLFDKKYIATINTPDNVLAASSTSSTYQTGMPRSVFASINLSY
ncbi:MAG: TonB-dependent receptor [Sulfurimonas sp.]